MNFFRHLWLITRHRFQVFINCTRCGIPIKGFIHDLSKYSFAEFWCSVKYYQGNKSPIVGEREQNDDYSMIYNHHVGHNKHHWEHWINFYREHMLIKALPYKICIEYCCDMIAASQTYNKRNYEPILVLEYWNKRKDKFFIHSMTKRYITWFFEEYVAKGFKGINKKITKRKYQDLFVDIRLIEKFKVVLTDSKL